MGRLAVILGSSASALGGGAAGRGRGAGRGSGDPAPRQTASSASPTDRPRREPAQAARAGCDRVLGIGSVGSLKQAIEVGSSGLPGRLHRPADSASPPSRTPAPTSTPGFDQRLAGAGAGGGRGGRAAVDGGVYWQAIGPRFETPAEIRLMAAHADLVGMTIASECVIAGELGLALRRALRGRQPRQRDRLEDRSASPSWKPTAHANAPACATALEAICCRRLAGVEPRASLGARARRRDASACAARTGDRRDRARASAPSPATR